LNSQRGGQGVAQADVEQRDKPGVICRGEAIEGHQAVRPKEQVRDNAEGAAGSCNNRGTPEAGGKIGFFLDVIQDGGARSYSSVVLGVGGSCRSESGQGDG